MVGQARREIERANQRFDDGIRNADAAIVGRLYTKDALLMPPDFETTHGREGTQELWGGAIKMGVKDAVLKTVEFVDKSDTAEEIGNYTLKIHPAGQSPFEDKGKHVVIWKRDTDGEWRLHRDIWNSSMPTKSQSDCSRLLPFFRPLDPISGVGTSRLSINPLHRIKMCEGPDIDPEFDGV